MIPLGVDKTRLAAAYKYANTRPSLAEARYASAYITWMANGANGNTPRRGRLSLVAAACIRTEIHQMALWRRP